MSAVAPADSEVIGPVDGRTRFNMMEDAATAEICRSQISQWMHIYVTATAEICRSQISQWMHIYVTVADGQTVDGELVRRIVTEELAKLDDDFLQARSLLDAVTLAEEFAESLTLPAYELMP